MTHLVERPSEVLGNLANKGKEYEPKGQPTRVDVHDFPDPKLGKAVPYGVLDLAANEGFVVVGRDGDTAAFAVSPSDDGGTPSGRSSTPTPPAS